MNDLALLPGKEELFSKLLFLINAPATRLATVLNATGRNLAVVLDQAAQQEKFVGSAAEPASASAAASPVDPAQPEDGADSQAGQAATEAPVEG